MTSIAMIAFDLDGTLLDTSAAVTHALNMALYRAGLPRFDTATVRGWIGGGPDALIDRALRTLAVPEAERSALAAQMRRDFDDTTTSEPMAEDTAYDGIPELLKALGAQMPLAVVTNKPTPLARAVLKDARVLKHFAAVHGADTAEQRKPSPRLLQHAAERAGVPPEALLMVGDAAVDMAAARAAGSQAAWAAWGFTREAPQPAPRWTLHTPRDLLARLHVAHAA